MKKIPVIILHGWGLSAKRYVPLQEELEKNNFSVLVPDLPGFGDLATINVAYTLEDYVTFVRSYYQSQGISQAIIIGHSFGGRVGIKFASEFPEAVTALVLTGTPDISPIPSFKRWIPMLLAKTGGLLFALPGMTYLADPARVAFYKLIGSRDYTRANAVLRQTFKLVVAEKLTHYMETISVPTLLLWGGKDALVPLWVARRMQRRIPNAKLSVIDFAGHAVPFSQPQQFCELLLAFLNTKSE